MAQRAARLGSVFNVCAAGECWPDGSLRVAVEDWLGAGAYYGTCRDRSLLRRIAAFEDAAPRLAEVIAQSSSGRELVERGYGQDVEIAVALDVSRHVPRFDGIAFVADQATPANSSL